MKVLRAGERYETEHDGIHTWHCFSAGAHYDPDNVNFGPLIAVDDHLLQPGAGFAEHAHRGVEIVSWIAEGNLEHSSGDETQVINAGESLIQDATETIRHVERNPSSEEPLRLIQTTFVAGAALTFDVLRADIEAPLVHLFVVDGSWTLDHVSLDPGDSARITDDGRHTLNGSGTVLALRGK